MSIKLVIFDLDGTLIDSSEGVTKSAQYALKRFGIEEHDLDKLKKFIGPPLFMSFEKYYNFSNEDALKAVEVFRERYNVTGFLEFELYPGVEECLKELKSQGYKIALGSSKPEPTCKKILENKDVLKYFDCVTGASFDGKIETKEEVLNELFSRCPEIAKDEMILIGDTLFDVEGANKAEINSIAVSFGFGDVDEMLEAGSLAVCDDLRDLADILANLRLSKN